MRERKMWVKEMSLDINLNSLSYRNRGCLKDLNPLPLNYWEICAALALRCVMIFEQGAQRQSSQGKYGLGLTSVGIKVHQNIKWKGLCTGALHDLVVFCSLRMLWGQSLAQGKRELCPWAPGWAHPQEKGTSRGSSAWVLFVVGLFRAKCLGNCSKCKWEHEGTFLK